MKKQHGHEIEAIGINYTVHISNARPTFFNLFPKTRVTTINHQNDDADHPSAEQPPISRGKICRRKVLIDVNCRAKPSEILAVVGPSGAGKSSLLEVLAGKISPDSGSLYVSGKPSVTTHFRRISGYVTQKDTLFPLLTVEETLLFSAFLRLRLPVAELRARLAALLDELGLAHVAGARVGCGEGGKRGVSGGERRRISIGVQVIHDPEILILDEPTSGLDSSSALQIIQMLSSMAANKGRTIILSIHQPGFRIVQHFTSVLLLADGAVVQNGTVEEITANLGSMGLDAPPHVNIIDFLMESIEAIQNQNQLQPQQPQDPPHLHHHHPPQRKRTSLQQLFQQAKVVDEEVEMESLAENEPIKFAFANSRLKETLILSHRFSKIVFRTKELFLCRTLQMLISGLVLGSIFFDLSDDLEGAMERMGLFAFILTFLLSSAVEALPIFLQEREILMKETSSGSYRVSSYAIANSIVYLPFLLILATLFAVPVYWLAGLNQTFSAFFYFLLLIWMILYTANSVVVCFSALVPDFIVGNSVISGVMGSFFLFSGYFISKNEIPRYWVWMHHVSLFKYPYEGLLMNEFSGADKCLERVMGICAVTGKGVLSEEGIREDYRWWNVVFTVCFIVLYRLISYVILRFRCSQWSFNKLNFV